MQIYKTAVNEIIKNIKNGIHIFIDKKLIFIEITENRNLFFTFF